MQYDGHKRFSAKKTLIAEIRPYSIIRGQIISLSMEGLTFFYLQPLSLHLDGMLEYFELAILQKDNTVLIEGIPCKTVSDLEMPKDFLCMIMQERQFSVKFDRLSSNQTIQLQSIINKYCN
jgi:hypothetical protein